jgi:small-conductance mechanosensitive channel
MDQLAELINSLGANEQLRNVLVIIGAVVLAVVIRLLFARLFLALTRRTATDVDDRIARALEGPVSVTILLIGASVVLADTPLPDDARYVARGVIITLLTVVWSVAAMRIGGALLDAVSRSVDRLPWIEPKTLPLFSMLLKVTVVGGLLYFVCIAWRIPLTSWLTSAGIVGIAVGFAARDTLANLFAGVFIIADAPYKVGDFIILDTGLRGVVSEIGIRSTRLLTRDDIEVTVPNAIIASSKIVNETGGPNDKMRVRVKVAVAYGSDIDQVEQVLLSSVEGVESISSEPVPRVRFREFGDSGLVFELLAWIEEPVYRGRVLHHLNGAVYKKLGAAGIEIPYNKLDVYLKGQPAAVAEEVA